jgi:hypothetical protein
VCVLGNGGVNAGSALAAPRGRSPTRHSLWITSQFSLLERVSRTLRAAYEHITVPMSTYSQLGLIPIMLRSRTYEAADRRATPVEPRRNNRLRLGIQAPGRAGRALTARSQAAISPRDGALLPGECTYSKVRYSLTARHRQ